VVESVKAASDLVMPVSGELVAVNDALTQAPDLANSDPFGGAWMIKVRLDNTGDLAALLEPAAYEKFCESRAH
jgi:glycine cleavage system H protein